jgi:hypothetical protein
LSINQLQKVKGFLWVLIDHIRERPFNLKGFFFFLKKYSDFGGGKKAAGVIVGLGGQKQNNTSPKLENSQLTLPPEPSTSEDPGQATEDVKSILSSSNIFITECVTANYLSCVALSHLTFVSGDKILVMQHLFFLDQTCLLHNYVSPSNEGRHIVLV